MRNSFRLEGFLPLSIAAILSLFGVIFIGILGAQVTALMEFGEIISGIGRLLIAIGVPTAFFFGCGIIGIIGGKLFEKFLHWYQVYRPKKYKVRPVNLKDKLHPETAELVCRMMSEDYIVTRDPKTLDFLKSLYYSMGRLDEWKTLSKRFPADSDLTVWSE